ncbi:hypothetical protein IAT40_002524 [Kwoniella sp. CBS 6097]
MRFSFSVAFFILSSSALTAPIPQGPGGRLNAGAGAGAGLGSGSSLTGAPSGSPFTGGSAHPPLASVTATGPPIPMGNADPGINADSTAGLDIKGKGVINGQPLVNASAGPGPSASASGGPNIGSGLGSSAGVGPSSGSGSGSGSGFNGRRQFGKFANKAAVNGPGGPPAGFPANRTDSPFNSTAPPFAGSTATATAPAGSSNSEAPLSSINAAAKSASSADAVPIVGAPVGSVSAAANLSGSASSTGVAGSAATSSENTIVAAIESASATVTDMAPVSNVPLPSATSAGSAGGASSVPIL